jgi:16S rRNA (cytidine1402-2'-O)-methyltransferase
VTSISPSSGVLVLVATPIGNMGDLSPRAVDALSSAHAICCEDTRRTGLLLQRAGIARTGRLIRVDDHTEAIRTADVLALLDAGHSIAVVTDAGTPGISDPGERLVRAAAEHGHRVTIVPGPSAVVGALAVSGLPSARFAMEGFLPRKGRDRKQRLVAIAADDRTTVIYEAPGRVAGTLSDLASHCGGERAVCVVRELTKLHEEIWRGTLADAVATRTHDALGEHVIVVAGAPPADPPDDRAVADALSAAFAGSDRETAVTDVATRLGLPRRRVYEMALLRLSHDRPRADG